jgi:glycyl-tRNA synthetase beta chain
VLRARFADALFFWNADQRAPLRDRAALLEKVTYQAKLGSYGDKVRRMKALAEHLCASLEARGILKAGQCGHVLRAVELCKCDLTTQMVQEFPELQGVVGGLYSVAQGEPPEVSGAIYDHYLPHGAEDRCPRSLVGAVVSLADKLDAVVGGFAVGLEPTGSSDPFALRRQANGTVKVLLEFRLPLSLKRAVEQALNALNIVWRTSQLEVFQRVLEFFEERLRYYFEAVRSFRYDTVRAVLAAGWDVPVDAMARAEGLEAIRGGENLEPLAVAAKRIKNILTKSATAADWEPGEVDTKLWQERGEEELYQAYLTVAEEAATLGQAGEYRQALETIASLRPAVDRFFDKVLVMAEDRALRQNRLRLLGKLDELFSGIAQFAEIAGQ